MINLYCKNFNFNLSNYTGVVLNGKNEKDELITRLNKTGFANFLNMLSFKEVSEKISLNFFSSHNNKPLNFQFERYFKAFIKPGILIFEDIGIGSFNEALIFNYLLDNFLYSKVAVCPVISINCRLDDIYNNIMDIFKYDTGKSCIIEIFKLRLKYFSATRLLTDSNIPYARSVYEIINLAKIKEFSFCDNAETEVGLLFSNGNNKHNDKYIEIFLKILPLKKFPPRLCKVVNKKRIMLWTTSCELYFDPAAIINKMLIYPSYFKKERKTFYPHLNIINKKTPELKSNNRGNLSPVQNMAKKEVCFPSLIIAGAGSGKTGLIVNKFLHLTNFTSPYEILVLTFTNNAVAEIKQRILSSLNIKGVKNSVVHKNLKIQTYHSFFYSLIKEFYKKLGLSVIPAIEPDDETGIYGIKYDSLFSNGSDIHETKLKFYDIIKLCIKLLKNEGTVREIAGRYKYILIDEYQDLDFLSDVIVKKLDHGRGNIMFAGDDDQSIYSFNGGNPLNLLTFDHFFPSGKLFVLQTNYRSNADIIDFSNSIVSRIKFRFSKNMLPPRSQTNNSINPSFKASVKTGIIKIKKFKNSLAEENSTIISFADSVNSGQNTAILMRTKNEEKRYLNLFKIKWEGGILKNCPENKNWFIGTIHKAKGMEFDTVFIINASSGNIPHYNSYLSIKRDRNTTHPLNFLFDRNKSSNIENIENLLEEERRLFYVAISRAKQRIYISYSGKKSEFL